MAPEQARSHACVHPHPRYPKIVKDCIEEFPELIDGVEVPVDTSTPNPNGMEFDNLYLVGRARGRGACGGRGRQSRALHELLRSGGWVGCFSKGEGERGLRVCVWGRGWQSRTRVALHALLRSGHSLRRAAPRTLDA